MSRRRLIKSKREISPPVLKLYETAGTVNAKMTLFVYEDNTYDLLNYGRYEDDIISKGTIDATYIIKTLDRFIDRGFADRDYVPAYIPGSEQRLVFYDIEGTQKHIVTNALTEDPEIVVSFVRLLLKFMHDERKIYYNDF